ncbi:MAG: M20/M25/M40 family metallo-hydrolase [Planctomycetota bacterium]
MTRIAFYMDRQPPKPPRPADAPAQPGPATANVSTRSAAGRKAVEEREALLLDLAGTPTAAFREHAVIEKVRKWAERRSDVVLRKDRYGNLMLSLEGVESRLPVYFTAHMDHPAFVVEGPYEEALSIEASFRGGVKPAYFVDKAVRLRPGRADEAVGRVTAHRPPRDDKPDAIVDIAFDKPVSAKAGDLLTWDLPRAELRDGRLHAPACDDLAGLAAALCAFDALRSAEPRLDVRVLLTRAEEVGFIGALAAARSQTLPRAARLICLECSKAFDDSPIHAGPIVRVGDRSGTFDPKLTYQLSRIAERLAAESGSFRHQRKLMPGGTCEASAFTALRYAASCLCLPLGNYHNMAEPDASGEHSVALEVIGLDDFHALVRLLVASAHGLIGPDREPSLRRKLDKLYRSRAADLR